jgi:hypothetical protein
MASRDRPIQLRSYLANLCDKLGLWFSSAAPFLTTVVQKRRSEMRHLSSSERPHYVSDRLSAISNVPMQFLVSAGLVVTILTAASFADFAEKSEAAWFVDAQQTASILRTTDRNVTVAGVNRCQTSTSSGHGPSGAGS